LQFLHGSGNSAGGHLALTTAMIPESAGLDRECPGVHLPKVAAVVDWYGITDVNDLLEGENQRAYAVQWLGSAGLWPGRDTRPGGDLSPSGAFNRPKERESRDKRIRR
jgi:hypothetical protein